eukprot:GEMP01049385.1.p1 GENE.GEMP01049385.1~~GEMP01049385.1.p1  ORF type:complete len:154 (+),score=21.84 GEMP01049385.1:459-920(+)
MTSCRFVVWVLLPCCTRSLSVAEKNDANEQRYLSVERDFSQLATKIRDGSVVMSTRFHQMLAAATRLTPLTVLSLLVCCFFAGVVTALILVKLHFIRKEYAERAPKAKEKGLRKPPSIGADLPAQKISRLTTSVTGNAAASQRMHMPQMKGVV